MKHWLRTLLKVRPEEQQKVLLMLLYSTALIAGSFIVGRTAASTLFLRRVDPTWLPLTFVAISLSVVGAMAIFQRVSRGVSLGRAALTTLVGAALLVLALRGALSLAPQSMPLMAGLMICFEVLGVLTLIHFWVLANELFTAREGKRLFGLITAGGPVAGLVFGGVIHAFVEDIGAQNLLFLSASLYLCAWWVARGLIQNHLQEAPRKRAEGEERRAAQGGLSHLLEAAPHLKIFAGIAVTLTLVVMMVDYQWMMIAREHFLHDEAGLARYFGTFHMVLGVLALVVQLFLTGRILERFGILFGMLLLPGLLLPMVGLVALSPLSFMAVTGAKGVDVLFRYSVNNPTFELLYQPVPPELRARAKSLLKGVVDPVASAISGLLLAGLVLVLDLTQLSYISGGLLVVWLGLTVVTRRKYTHALSANLRHRKLTLQLSLPTDETTQGVIREALKGEDELLAYHALALVEGEPERWGEEIVSLLGAKRAGLRARALTFIGRPENEAYQAEVMAALHDPDPEVRAAAVRAYCAMVGPRSVPALRGHLDAEEPETRAAVISGLIVHGGLDGMLLAAEPLKGMLEHSLPGMRAAAARTLGEIGVRHFYQPLIPLLEDPEDAVREAAIWAAGEIANPDLVSRLLPALADPRLRAYAERALASIGDEAVEGLAEVLVEPGAPRWLSETIPGVLGALKTPPAQAALEAGFELEDEALRGASIKALVGFASIPSSRLEGLVRLGARELSAWVQWQVIRKELGRVEEGLLGAILEERILAARSRLFGMLSLLLPHQPVGEIEARISGRDPKAKGAALELLDNVVPMPLKRPLLTLLEAEKGALPATLREGARHQERMEWFGWLLGMPDPWLRVCVLFELTRAPEDAPRAGIEAALEAKEALVREAAVVAMKSLTSYEDWQRIKTGKPTTEFAGLPPEEEGMLFTTAERVLTLKRVDLFAKIPGGTLASLARIAKVHQHEAEVEVIREGEAGDCLFVILKGVVRVEVKGKCVARLGPCEAFGEMSLLDAEPRSATVVAEEALILLEIGREGFYGLMAQHPVIAQGVIGVLTRRLRDANREAK